MDQIRVEPDWFDDGASFMEWNGMRKTLLLANVMSEQMKLLVVLLVIVLLSIGCHPFDPEYETKHLVGTFNHFTNGGESGTIRNGEDSVYPNSDRGWFCNECSLVAGKIVGIEFKYGERKFVDPHHSVRFFCFDTSKMSAETFPDPEALLHFLNRNEGDLQLPEYFWDTHNKNRKTNRD